MLRTGLPITPCEMNVINRAQWKFWTGQIEAKMRDPEILAEAVKDLEANAKAPTVALRMSFEDALRGAEARVMLCRRIPAEAAVHRERTSFKRKSSSNSCTSIP